MKLYNGEVDLDFNEGSHRYKVNGQYVEGVTTILSKVIAKDGLLQWAVDLCMKEGDRKAHTYKKDAGANVGTQVHKWIEAYLGDKSPEPLSGEAALAVNAFLSWERDNKPEYLFSERILYNRADNYCGTADVAFTINGKRYLADFKTANPKREYKNGKYTGRLRPYPEHFIQCAAYALAYICEENAIRASKGNYTLDYKPFDAYMIIYITKSGELHTFETDDVTRCELAWRGALTLARQLKALENA